MKRIIILTITCLLAICHVKQAQAAYIREYTHDKPLIIVSDWEFPPYEYRNDIGEPDGYNIEVLNLILNKLNIPHQYVMKEWYQCTEAFDKHKAELIHALKFKYSKAPFEYTHNMITYYKVRAVRLKTTRPLHHISQLTSADTLTLKKNDYAALMIAKQKDRAFSIEYHSPREALMGIRNGKYKYYMWGEQPLHMKVKELDLDGIEFDETDIPAAELRIIGYDKELIHAIDDTYARLEQSGDIQRIRDKWFHPEKIHNDASPMALILLISIIIAAVVVLLFSRVMRIRVKNVIEKSVDIKQMMTEALNSGNYYVIVYDTHTGRIKNRYGDMLPEEGLTSTEFLDRLPDEDRGKFSEAMQQMAKGQKDLGYLKRRFNKGTVEAPDWRWIEGHAVVEYATSSPRPETTPTKSRKNASTKKLPANIRICSNTV